MKKFAVLVATTGGAVQIERLTAEHAPQSLVCIRRSSTVLDISRDYDDFIRRGSGIIEREFGPFEYESFRADVSEHIGAGQSWQLSMFLAHAIHAGNGVSLTEHIEEADQVLWATGQVDYDLNVSSVDHVSRKIESSKPFLKGLPDDQGKITLIVPAGHNFNQLIETRELHEFRHIQAGHAHTLCQDLGIPVKHRLAPPKPRRELWRSRQNLVPKLSLGLAVILGIILFWAYGKMPAWNELHSRPDAKISESVNSVKVSDAKPAVRPEVLPKGVHELPSRANTKIAESEDIVSRPIETEGAPPDILLNPVTVEVAALKPPSGGNCAQVAFAGRRPQVERLAPDKKGILKESRLSETCGLQFTADAGETMQFVALHLDVKSGFHLKPDQRPVLLAGNIAFRGRQSWSIELPRRLKQAYSYNLVMLSSLRPVAQYLPKARKSDSVSKAHDLPETVRQVVLHHKVKP